jgi:diguanylate cyclase (GGDEF)-like protein
MGLSPRHAGLEHVDMVRRGLPVTLYIVLALSACIAALGLITYRVSEDAFERERSHAERELRAMTQQAKFDEESTPSSMTDIASKYAADPGVASMDPGQCQAALAGLENALDGGYFEVVDRSGSSVCSVYGQDLKPTGSFHAGQWFEDLLTAGETTVLPPAHDQAIDGPAITAFSPIVAPADPSTIVGGLLLVAKTAYPLMLPQDAANGAVLVLTDASRSMVLATSDGAQVAPGQDLTGTVLAQPLPVGSAVVDLDGTRRMYAEATVESSGEHVLAGVPEEAILAPAKEQMQRNFLIGGVTIAVVLLTGVLLQRRLARPLRRVATAIRDNLERDDAVRAPEAGPREVVQVAAVFNDLITERQAREVDLARQARRDSLTGLPNRMALVEHLTEVLESGTDVAVGFLDLDRFKNINDAHGHAVGDRMLVALAARLADSFDGAFVSRFGGDEYVMVWSGGIDEEKATRLAQRISHVLRIPVDIDGQELYLTGSIGIALAVPGETPDDLIRSADTAMYRAKELGRDRCAVFNQSMREWALLRASTEHDLHSAIGSNQLTLHYQPKYSLSDGRAIGAEALLRWEHPTRGFIPPGEFIPVAEESGLIVPIGVWVLEQACKQAVAWRERLGGTPFPIAVNLSAQQLALPDLPDIVARILERTGAASSDIVLEVTESAVLTDVERVSARLRTMRERGLRISVDDFGTGYSSLSYIQQLPIDELKIDRAFVSPLPYDETSTEIVGSVIKLAHAIGLEVVAEGVENASQLVALDALGCDTAQGFFLARPAPAEVIEREVLDEGPADLEHIRRHDPDLEMPLA